MVSFRSRWHGRHGAWLIDTLPRMVSLTIDSPQRNTALITPPWPSVSESVLRVWLGVTVFCILALPRVTLGVTAKEVNYLLIYWSYYIVTYVDSARIAQVCQMVFITVQTDKLSVTTGTCSVRINSTEQTTDCFVLMWYDVPCDQFRFIPFHW